MNTSNIKIGKTYRYKELCSLLGVKCEDGQNKKVEQLEEFERYFDYERPDKYHFLVFPER